MLEKLRPLPAFRRRPGPLVLCIMDGVGCAPPGPGNAVAAALTPNLDRLSAGPLGCRLKAHGTAVGMPSDNDMGNSEIGHNAIGCGRVFAQGAKLVAQAITSGQMFRGQTWQDLIANCREHASTLHLIGLLSDGNVHSHIDHVRAMVTAAAAAGVGRLRMHPLLDGRDVGETSALDYIEPLAEFLAGFDGGLDYRIGSGGGRMNITMDRYGANWDMVRRGWDTHVHGVGRPFASAAEAVRTYREEIPGVIDQDLPAFVIAADGEPVGRIVDGDAVVMFNFRGDRALELTEAFEADDFEHFDRGRRPHVLYAGMMEYDGDLHVPGRYLVAPPLIDRTVGEYFAANGVRQLAISETQKFGHVTYFFNGNRSGRFNDELETYTEVTSDIVPFEQRPWMKAAPVTDALIDAVRGGAYDYIRLNFANGDMVGHTGVYAAAQVAVETVDLCLGRLMQAVAAVDGVMLVTADHGNAEEMFETDEKTGAVIRAAGAPKSKTSHTLNPVPCLIYDPRFRGEYAVSADGQLGIASLAATCMNFLGYEAPPDYAPAVIRF